MHSLTADEAHFAPQSAIAISVVEAAAETLQLRRRMTLLLIRPTDSARLIIEWAELPQLSA